MKQYVDVILKSTGTLATSQIAADYGMNAYKLNAYGVALALLVKLILFSKDAIMALCWFSNKGVI